MRYILFIALLLPLAGCGNGQPFGKEGLLASLQAVGNSPGRPNYVESAQAAEQQGDYVQAAGFYRQALDANPGDIPIALSLAESYRRSGSFEHALTMYDALLQQDAKLVAAKEGKALTLMGTGDYERPTVLFDEVMKAEPTRWKTLNGLGILFATRGMYNEASQYFQEALKYSTNNPALMDNLGLARALEKDYKTASFYLEQAAAITPPGSPERKRVDMDRSLIAAAGGKLDEARTISALYYSPTEAQATAEAYARIAADQKIAGHFLHAALTGEKLPDSYVASLHAPVVAPNVQEVKLAKEEEKAADAVSGLAPAATSDPAPSTVEVIEAEKRVVKQQQSITQETAPAPKPVAAPAPKPEPKPKKVVKKPSKPKPVAKAEPKPEEKTEPVKAEAKPAPEPEKKPEAVAAKEPDVKPEDITALQDIVSAPPKPSPLDEKLANIIGATD